MPCFNFLVGTYMTLFAVYWSFMILKVSSLSNGQRKKKKRDLLIKEIKFNGFWGPKKLPDVCNISANFAISHNNSLFLKIMVLTFLRD